MAEPSMQNIDLGCFECGDVGHTTQLCLPKHQVGRGMCFTCDQLGHYCYTCSVPYCPSCEEHHQPEGYPNKQEGYPKNQIACIRCGEKGHRDDQCQESCPNCEEDHPPGECPMEEVTCFLCESKDHCPTNCPLRSALIAVTQQRREDFQAALRHELTKKDEAKSTPANSTELDSRKVTRAQLKQIKNVTCYGCGDIGHFVNKCPKKKRVATCPSSQGRPHKKQDQARGSVVQQVRGLIMKQPQHDTKVGREATMASKASDYDKAKLGKPREGTLCYRCGRVGHFAIACPQKGKGRVCDYCGQLGHYVTQCPLRKPGHQDIQGAMEQPR